MAELLNIKEILKELQYRDLRSVKSWCHNNNVQILSYTGSYKQFVLKEEFEKALFKYFHKHSKKINLTINISSDNRNKKVEYKPQGEYEKEFLSIFTNTLATL